MSLETMIACFKEQYGDSACNLIESLKKPIPKVALINPFIDQVELKKLGLEPGIIFTSVEPQIQKGLLSHYFLDQSSIFAPGILPLENGMNVLDMCSAPGGKLLVLLSRQLDLKITANDLSRSRIFRLKTVLNKFVPAKTLSNIKITNKDAIFFGLKEPSSYDAILLDAPCSSEAHVVNDEKLLKKYHAPAKSLPFRQYSLLASAWLALKPGGHIVYATCSINKNENEAVVKKLNKKNNCSIVDFSLPLGQKNDMGYTILPHMHKAGPAFLSLIKKNS
jgi:16S rRNA C967 or C1407 C5-methylase (RsmB/RsmF family)